MSDVTPVLAISGKRFYGKDRLAAEVCRLAEERGAPLARRALADQSKQAFAEVVAASEGEDIDLQRFSSDRAYKERWRPRLTEFTEAELAKDARVFCRRVFAAPLPEGARAYLISDVRLRCEVDCLRERGGVFLARLRVDDDVRRGFGWSPVPGVDDHRTETELDAFDAWDAVVDNPGTPEGLAAEAARLLDQFLARTTGPSA